MRILQHFHANGVATQTFKLLFNAELVVPAGNDDLVGAPMADSGPGFRVDSFDWPQLIARVQLGKYQ
jgi:hypothetical protein